MNEQPSAIHYGVMAILREEGKFEPHLEARLSQLFEDNRFGFANAILRIENAMHQQLCDLKQIDKLRHKTVEFVIWALERSEAAPKMEFDWVNQLTEENEERQEILVGATIVEDYASGKFNDFEVNSASKRMIVNSFEFIKRIPELMFMWMKKMKRNRQSDQ